MWSILAVQDSSIGDIVSHFEGVSTALLLGDIVLIGMKYEL